MERYGNYMRNVWTPKSRHSRKKSHILTQPWVLPSKTYARIMETFVENYYITIGSR